MQIALICSPCFCCRHICSAPPCLSVPLLSLCQRCGRIPPKGRRPKTTHDWIWSFDFTLYILPLFFYYPVLLYFSVCSWVICLCCPLSYLLYLLCPGNLTVFPQLVCQWSVILIYMLALFLPILSDSSALLAWLIAVKLFVDFFFCIIWLFMLPVLNIKLCSNF